MNRLQKRIKTNLTVIYSTKKLRKLSKSVLKWKPYGDQSIEYMKGKIKRCLETSL